MFLYIGRANDPIKRINLVHDSLLKIKDGIKKYKNLWYQKILVLEII